MAKRRAAEPVTFHVPWKRLLLCDFAEQPPPPPLWIRPPGVAHAGQLLGVPEQHRKRKIDAGTMAEPSASPSKRRDSGDNSTPEGGERRGHRSGRGRRPPEAHPESPMGRKHWAGRGGNRPWWGAIEVHNEEFWQYNTFQYWRNPLPPIDLADIEDLSEDTLTEATLQGRSEGAEVDMES
uniref:Putative WW-binding domain-containing protein n=1 Tax=Pan paniscus TaxID=9597 RepID=A0A2R9B5D9_PANPA